MINYSWWWKFFLGDWKISFKIIKPNWIYLFYFLMNFYRYKG